MASPRISETQSPNLFERLAVRWSARYATAMLTIALACLISYLLGASVEKYYHVLIYFTAILLSGVVAGWGPGLLATALAIGAVHLAQPAELNVRELRLLVIEGVLVSIIGGFLRSERRKARTRLQANLKLEQQILEIGDDERRRIGLDLHDGLGQHLTGISLLSESIAQRLEKQQSPDPGDVETITRLVSESVRITRDLAKSLSPVTLERDGLIAAVEELAETSSALLGIDCQAEYDGEEITLDRPRSLHMFRIAQEAVNNSVRHGKAKNVRIRVARRNGDLSITIADDGSGLSQETAVNPGLGIRIMQYRARILGATLTAERAGPTGGTIVTCLCPIDSWS